MHIPTPPEIRAKRIMLGLKQSEVAKEASISQSMIARIEAGTVDPRVSTLRRILEILQRAERSSTTAADLMHAPVVSVAPEDSIIHAVRIMEQNGISQLPVLKDGWQVGCISESAVIGAMEEGRLGKTSPDPVSGYMEEGFPTVPPTEDVNTLVHLLHTHHALLVVERGKVIGVITKHDLISLIR